MSIPKVIVTMPRCGLVWPEAMISKLVPSCWNVPEEDRVEIFGQADANSSLLPHVFNDLLKEAMVHRDRGEVTHLAMLHSDIEAVGYWLTELWKIMRRLGLAAVSAVSPIKDHWTDTTFAGRTSTAFGIRDDPWVVHRFVKLEDRQPMIDVGLETFQPRDVCKPGEVLLINTACMLLDLTHPCWEVPAYEGDGNLFSFSFRNRLCRDVEQKYTTWVRSEDWEMSRHLDRCGAPYAATWAVKIKHHGYSYWTNYPEEPKVDPDREKTRPSTVVRMRPGDRRAIIARVAELAADGEASWPEVDELLRKYDLSPDDAELAS